MLARVLLIVVAVACALTAAAGLRTSHRCDAAQKALNAKAVAAGCGDPRDRAVTAAVLAARGRRADALALVRRMTRDAPQDFLGWVALGRLTADDRALARAHALNPRGVPPPARPR